MPREYFCAYHSYLKAIETLTDVERGRLFAALLEYSMTGAAPELRGSERHVFPLMREQIDRDKNKYEEKCRKAKKSITGRWDTNVYERIPTYTNEEKTYQGKDKDKDKDKDKGNINSAAAPRQRKKFIPPTLEEIQAYCTERKNSVDSKRFFDYFDASGWIDSEGKPVRNWKQKVITWEGNLSSKNKQMDASQSSYDMDKLENILLQGTMTD